MRLPIHTVATHLLKASMLLASSTVWGQGIVAPQAPLPPQGFFEQWNSPEWNMPTPAKVKTPGHGAGIFNRKGTYSAYPEAASDLYTQGGENLPMPQLRNTWDRYNQMIIPRVQAVQEFVQPLPGGQAYSDSLQSHLVQPRRGTEAGQKFPSNIPGLMLTLQKDPGAQLSQQATQIAAQGTLAAQRNGTLGPDESIGLTPAYSPSRIAQGTVRRVQGAAEEKIKQSLGEVAQSTAVFGMNYIPSIRNVPNYYQAGKHLLSGGE